MSTNLNTSSNLILTSIDGMTMWVKDELMFVADDLQNVSIQNNEETTDITGKNGRKLATLKQNKAVQITGSNGVILASMLSVQTGGKYVAEASYPVSWCDSVRISAKDEAETKFTAVGVTGQEIRAIVKESVGGSVDTLNQLKQVDKDAADLEAGEFTYEPETKKIVFADNTVDPGEIVRIFYTRNVPASHVDNPADQFSAEGLVIFDCTARDICQNYYRAQLVVPRADFTGNFNIDIGTEQALHNFEINALSSVTVCDKVATDQAGIYWDFIVFDRDTDDAD